MAIGKATLLKSILAVCVGLAGLYLLALAVGFMGYILPVGQLSFYAASILTRLVKLAPYIILFLVPIGAIIFYFQRK